LSGVSRGHYRPEGLDAEHSAPAYTYTSFRHPQPFAENDSPAGPARPAENRHPRAGFCEQKGAPPRL